MVTRARILAEMGRKQDAMAQGEKAIAFGKAQAQPPILRISRKFMAEWK